MSDFFDFVGEVASIGVFAVAGIMFLPILLPLYILYLLLGKPKGQDYHGM